MSREEYDPLKHIADSLERIATAMETRPFRIGVDEYAIITLPDNVGIDQILAFKESVKGKLPDSTVILVGGCRVTVGEP
jgi:hypothetical protein